MSNELEKPKDAVEKMEKFFTGMQKGGGSLLKSAFGLVILVVGIIILMSLFQG